jgi:hypothetical protein
MGNRANSSGKKNTKMNRKQCLALVDRINDLNAIRAMVADVAKGNQKRGTWSYFAQKLLTWIDSGMTGKPPFSVIIANGNKNSHSLLSVFGNCGLPGQR